MLHERAIDLLRRALDDADWALVEEAVLLLTDDTDHVGYTGDPYGSDDDPYYTMEGDLY